MTAKIKSRPNYTKTSHKHRPKGVSSHSFEKVYWPYIPVIIIASLVIGTSAASGQLRTAVSKPFSSVLAYATSLSQAELLSDTNAARAANDKQPLKLNPLLIKAAQAKANDMALRNYWSHYTPAGNPPWVFVTATNYQYDRLGENLAAGFADSQSTINGWMASPEHKENMLNSDYTEVGFGFANNPNYTSSGNNGPMTIVVAFYGKPAISSNATDISLAAASGNITPSNPSATKAASISLGSLPYANFAPVILISLLSAGIGLWVGRHLLALKRSFVNGETYVRAHPLFDVGVLIIGAALLLLTRTVGLIQ